MHLKHEHNLYIWLKNNNN